MAKDEKEKRPRIEVPAEHGEFTHQAENAESGCTTARPAPRCACGMYDLAWAKIA